MILPGCRLADAQKEARREKALVFGTAAAALAVGFLTYIVK